MHRGRPIQRELLAGIFWPDVPEGRAKRRLSHTIWQIQDVVSEGSVSHLAATPDTLAFDTSLPYWLDTEQFDHCFEASSAPDPEPGSQGTLDSAALRTCVELYRGDFLAGYFDDWLVVDQDHYRQRFFASLDRLVVASKANGDYEEALAYARRLTNHDPLSEAAHQEVMRIYFLLGRTTNAVQQFELCRSVLSQELGTEPSTQTVDLYQRIIRHRRTDLDVRPGDDRAPLQMSRSEVGFVGREEERHSLIDYLEMVLAGPGGVVLVEGDPGVGKTRFAMEAAEDAEWRGFEVSWGTCKPGALRPFAPLTEVLESLSSLRVEQLSEQLAPIWISEALRLAPGLRGRLPESSPAPLHPAEESTRMTEALVNSLSALGRIAPHLVIVDDVHWADQDTLEVLAQLGSRLAGSRMLLMLLYRSEEGRGDHKVWDVLRGLDRSAGLGRTVLSPLSVFELADLVKRHLGLPRLEPSVATQLHRQTGGNALFALEILRSLRDQGLFDDRDSAEGVLEHHLTHQALPVAPRVRSIIDARMSLLDEEVTSVYEVAAVSVDPVDLSLLSAVADLPRHSVLNALAELVQRGLIREEGENRYWITHDQVREVVYQRIGKARRHELHRRVAQALTEIDPEEVEAIGHHYREGQLPDQAAQFLLKAGLRAQELNAYGTARHHLESARNAAAGAGWSTEDQYEILSHLEAVLNVLGSRREQHEVIESMSALAGSQPGLRGDLERRRAWLLAHQGDFIAAEEAARDSVNVERRRRDQLGLAASLVALGTCLRWSGRSLEAVPELEAAVVAAAGDPRQSAAALTELGSTLVEVQRADEAIPQLDAAFEVFRELNDLRGQAEVAGIQARAMRQRGAQNQAIAHYELAIELSQRVGYRHGEGVNLVNLSALHHLVGRVADAITGYERAAGLFADLGNRRGEATVLANAASARLTLLGDEERALADAERARAFFVEIGDRGREAQCLETIAGVASRRCQHDQARLMLEESLQALAGTGYLFLEGQHLRSLALLQKGQGEYQEALVTVDRALRLCAEANLDDLSVEIESIRGVILMRLNRVDEAYRTTHHAVEMLRPGVERPYLVHYRHAQVAETAGHQTVADAEVMEAHRLLEATLDGLLPVDRERALKRVPVHREIVSARNRRSPQTIQVLLPEVGAPSGRPLGDDELRPVTWTLSHPEDDRIDHPMERRRRRLLRLLTEADNAGTVPSIDILADALEVSPATVRRDLTALRQQGQPFSTRGQSRPARMTEGSG
jgi:DNA-binding SARP family transcriptional activator/DNA-binding transcriptional regulator YhcF (GntR family)